MEVYCGTFCWSETTREIFQHGHNTVSLSGGCKPILVAHLRITLQDWIFSSLLVFEILYKYLLHFPRDFPAITISWFFNGPPTISNTGSKKFENKREYTIVNRIKRPNYKNLWEFHQQKMEYLDEKWAQCNQQKCNASNGGCRTSYDADSNFSQHLPDIVVSCVMIRLHIRVAVVNCVVNTEKCFNNISTTRETYLRPTTRIKIKASVTERSIKLPIKIVLPTVPRSNPAMNIVPNKADTIQTIVMMAKVAILRFLVVIKRTTKERANEVPILPCNQIKSMPLMHNSLPLLHSKCYLE